MSSATLNLLTKKSPTKAKTKKEKAVEHLDSIQAAVHTIESLDEKGAHLKATELLNSADGSLFVLGGILDAIYTNAWHTGYEGFKDYVTDQFGMKVRKAMYLMKIYNDIVENEIPYSKVEKMGWTKLRIISSALTLDNIDQWVKRADTMTSRQLQEYLKTTKESGDSEEAIEEAVSKVTTFTVKLHEDQKETILEAIDAAKEVASTEFDAVALEYICMDYLGSSSGSKGKPSTKVSLAALMQNHSAEDVLEEFGKVFPEVNITAEL